MGLRTAALVALLAISGGAAAQDAPTDDEALLKELKPTELIRFAASGERTRVAFAYSLNPNCTSAGKTIVKVLKKPQHGEITVKNEDGFSNFADGNVRSRCNSVLSPTTSVYYTSEPDYVGEDRAQILIIYLGSGSANLDNLSVLVR